MLRGLVLCGLSAAAAAAACRDRWQRPFSSTSIYNTAVGSGAVFAHAQFYTGYFNRSWGCALRVSAANRRVDCKTPGTNGSTQGCSISSSRARSSPCRLPLRARWLRAWPPRRRAQS